MLRPAERGIAAHRVHQGLPPLYHCRLKHRGRTLAILSGDSEQEAHQRAQRLACALLPNDQGVTCEPA